MKSHNVFLVLIICHSCTPDKRVCEFTSANEELVIYNNILTEMIENWMHYRYLGGKEDEIFDKYVDYEHDVDTVAMQNELIKARNEVFNNPSKFYTIYLDTSTRREFFYDSAGIVRDVEFKALLEQYTTDTHAAVDSMNELQNRYSPGDFGLCTARIDYLQNLNDSTYTFGRLRLSKIVLNKERNKGMMYYNWHCGSLGLCGHQGIIRFAKGPKKWEIVDFEYWNVY